MLGDALCPQRLRLRPVVAEYDGDDTVLRFFDLVHVGDWLSLVLAERAGVDPVDIKNIDHLKNALAQIP